MRGDNRQKLRPRPPLLAVACLAAALALTGCSNWRQVIGLDQPAPDEFAVESRAPLTVPPEFSLRPPQPGAPRPQEVTAAERAQQIINAAGPGKPGDQASAALQPEMIGTQTDPTRQLHPNSIASRLLGATDSSAGGAIVGRRTSALQGVY
jgi:hypothetical protein